jgi:hypothetical protein
MTGCAALDHLHALDASAVHLCDSDHACPLQCELPGICEISTQPASVQAHCRGALNSFTYTKVRRLASAISVLALIRPPQYSQVQKRLPCAQRVPAGELYHQGQHVHSLDASVFHFCDVQVR